jgi:hypothetical protein
MKLPNYSQPCKCELEYSHYDGPHTLLNPALWEIGGYFNMTDTNYTAYSC